MFEDDVAECVDIGFAITNIDEKIGEFRYTLIYRIAFANERQQELPYHVLVTPLMTSADMPRVGPNPGTLEPPPDGTLTFDFQPIVYPAGETTDRDVEKRLKKLVDVILATLRVERRPKGPRPKIVPIPDEEKEQRSVKIPYGGDADAYKFNMVYGNIPSQTEYLELRLSAIPHPIDRKLVLLYSPLRCKMVRVQGMIKSGFDIVSDKLFEYAFVGPARIVIDSEGETSVPFKEGLKVTGLKEEPELDEVKEQPQTEKVKKEPEMEDVECISLGGLEWKASEGKVITPGDLIHLSVDLSGVKEANP